ncbi:MAG: hypothetical protein CFE24_02700 [Flavobacterium sp. BFFFF2]|nr:MAG: hypothetical protein CFE24_02700 [Flavobacterium sp. BFFFF2]
MIDFQTPQRQSAKGILTEFVYNLQQTVRAFGFLLILFLVKVDSVKIYVFFGITGIGLLIVFVIGYLKYRNYTFWLDQDKQEFIIRSGIFSKNLLVIQLNKIQQVHLSQSFLQSIIQVYSLEIDTAGTGKVEAKIHAISHEWAQALKVLLLQHVEDHSHETAQAEVKVETAMWHLPLLTLIKVGLTSKYTQSLWLILAFLGTTYNGYNEASELLPENTEEVASQWYQQFQIWWLPFLLACTILLFLMINLVRTVIRFFNYQVQQQNQSVTLSFGLFSRQMVLLKKSRVQWVSQTQNFIQKKLDMADLVVYQTESSSSHSKSKDKVEIPGCDTESVARFKQLFLGKQEAATEQLSANYRHMIFPILFLVVLPALIWINVGIDNWGYHLLFIMYIPLQCAWQYRSYKKSRLQWGAPFVQIRQGVWDVETQMLDVHKLQSIRIRQYFWHKKPNLGHVYLYTSAGVLLFRFGNYKKLVSLVNHWLGMVEQPNSRWM